MLLPLVMLANDCCFGDEAICNGLALFPCITLDLTAIAGHGESPCITNFKFALHHGV
jgi:hypothetical protein